MNGKDRIEIARVDERVKAIHSDIIEIKNSVKGIHGCIKNNELEIVSIRTQIKNHLENHKRDLVIFGVFITTISVIINYLVV